VRVPTTLSLFRFAAVTWQSHLVHFDQAAAAREGYPGVLVQASLHGAYLAQLMTSWARPTGRLSTLEWRNRRYATAGEQLTMRAVVTRREEVGERGLVECAMTEQHGHGDDRRARSGRAGAAPVQQRLRSHSLYRGDEMFGLLEKVLGERYPCMRCVPFSAFGSTHGPNDEALLAELPTRLAELGCDSVISAVGG
jgi:acyl dehydratase